MRVRHFEAVRFERVLTEGRTQPLVLACRPREGTGPAVPKVVKALGCPEVYSEAQLVAEVAGNAAARRMGVVTPEPCVVHVSEAAARVIASGLAVEGHPHRVRAGPAAGAELLRMAPYTIGQRLTPEQRTQAARLYVFDMLSQNADRRPAKVNCGMGPAGLTAFDFETCFAHLFVPVIGGLGAPPWEPSQVMRGRDHLFHGIAKANPLPVEIVESAVLALNQEWWEALEASLPEAWRTYAAGIGEVLREVAEHAREFARDIAWSLA